MTVIAGSMAAGMVRGREERKEERVDRPTDRQTRDRDIESLGLMWNFDSSKPTPSNIPPPARPYFVD